MNKPEIYLDEEELVSQHADEQRRLASQCESLEARLRLFCKSPDGQRAEIALRLHGLWVLPPEPPEGAPF